MKHLKLTALCAASLAFAACTTTGNVERNAAGGAVAGAVVGGIIGNNTGEGDAQRGAAVGAVIGGAAGAYKGYRDDQARTGGTTARPALDKSTRYYDDRTNRYYYYEQGTGRTFYENYEPRS